MNRKSVSVAVFLIGAAADVGLMLPLGPGWRQRQTFIADRFFLGGPGSLRGFHSNSVGPIDNRRKRSRSATVCGLFQGPVCCPEWTWS